MVGRKSGSANRFFGFERDGHFKEVFAAKRPKFLKVLEYGSMVQAESIVFKIPSSCCLFPTQIHHLQTVLCVS